MPAVFMYLTDACFFIRFSCALWFTGRILDDCFVRLTHAQLMRRAHFRMPKKPGERVRRLFCLMAENIYKKDTVILLCCAKVARFRKAATPFSVNIF